MADEVKEKDNGKKRVLDIQGVEVTQHLDRDPNDPRNAPEATPNLSDLNAEDPEKEPAKQSYQDTK